MLPFTASVLDARQFLSHSTDVASCPETDTNSTYVLQFRCGYFSGRNVPLQADKTDAKFPDGFACGDGLHLTYTYIRLVKSCQGLNWVEGESAVTGLSIWESRRGALGRPLTILGFRHRTPLDNTFPF